MTTNAPPELDLLRKVAAAARWAIDANDDDPVGRDGRSRVGFNWVAANGALAKALEALQTHYAIADMFAAEKAHADNIERQLRPKNPRNKTGGIPGSSGLRYTR